MKEHKHQVKVVFFECALSFCLSLIESKNFLVIMDINQNQTQHGKIGHGSHHTVRVDTVWTPCGREPRKIIEVDAHVLFTQAVCPSRNITPCVYSEGSYWVTADICSGDGDGGVGSER